MEAEIVRRVLVSRSLTIKDTVREDPDDVLIYATDGAGLTVSAELVVWDGRELRLALTDETSEGNFAIMFPKRDSVRSLQRCMEMSIDEIIEHAEP
jgi:hypothetical protein